MDKPLGGEGGHTREESLIHAILVTVLAVTLFLVLVLGRGLVMDGLVHSPALSAPAAQATPAPAATPGDAFAGVASAHS